MTARAERTRGVVLRGTAEPADPRRSIAIGPFTGLADGPQLRYVAFGGVEVLRGVYTAVRDDRWGTAAPESLSLALDEEDEAVRLSWKAAYLTGRLEATGSIELRPDATLVAEFRAVAHAPLRYNRIGICLLHPADECAGSTFTSRGPDGTTGVLPQRIGPQRIVDGLPAPLFPAMRELELQTRSGPVVRFVFEGDLFELEDQRNWTDDSFKTYSTPLALGFPHEAQAGTSFEQRVTMRVEERAPRRRRASRAEVVSLTLASDALQPRLPPVGLCAPSHQSPLEPDAAELLRALRPAHIRVELPPESETAEAALERGADLARALDVRLLPVLELGPEPRGQLERLPSLERVRDRIDEIVVVATGGRATGADEVRLVRERLRSALPGARFYGGTSEPFCELNRSPVELEGVDGVAYAIHPQQHVFDDLSIVETLPVQAETVESARMLADGRPVLVGPVTLRPHVVPETEGQEGRRDELPWQVDPRQLSLLGAAWTAGSLKYLAEAGAAGVTYYETTGWRGLIETGAGSPLPELFPSRPGEAFPLYHVLADVAEIAGEVVAVSSSDRLAAVALATRGHGLLHLLAANLRAEPTEVVIGPLRAPAVRARRLYEGTAALASAEPLRFRKIRDDIRATGDRVRMRLEPYEVARLEAVS